MEFGKKQIALFKAISLSLITVCFFMLFMPWLKIGIYEAFYDASAFSTACGAGSFWSVMLIINAILFILLTALAVYGLVTDRNTLVLPIAALGFLMFFMALFQLIHIRVLLTREAASYGYGWGGDSLSSIFSGHIGVGAWLMLFMSLLAYGAAILDNYANGKKLFDFHDFVLPFFASTSGTMAPRGGWVCPNCGARQGAALNFCDRCGTKKPEPPRCPNCGAIAKPGESFCSSCGTRL